MEKPTQEKITADSGSKAKVNCSMCRKEGMADQFTTLKNDKEENIFLCEECRGKVNAAFEDETKNPNILFAIIAGAIGGVIGGVIWYFVAIITGWEIGYVSLGLGYLVGLGVYWGAGKKRGHQLQIISALIAVVAIIVTEKFVLDYFLNDYIRNNPVEFPGFSVGQSISVSFFEPEFWENFISPIGLVIYAVGIYLAYNFCKPRKI